MLISKELLLDKMVNKPIAFTEDDLKQLLALKNEKGDMELNFADLRKNLLRIYDMNEPSLFQESNPMSGFLKPLNKWSTAWRKNFYFRKIKKHITQKEEHRLVLAEGDSWFQFPVFVKDIIDWILAAPDIAVHSIAAGGDWLANMIYEGKYIEDLSIHKPHAFLISGGGNDFIGSNRISVMVEKTKQELKYKSKEELVLAAIEYNITDEEKEKFFYIQQFINSEFYAFIWTLKTQYWILFSNLHQSKKFPAMRIITQGYDNVFPSSKHRWSWRYPLQ